MHIHHDIKQLIQKSSGLGCMLERLKTAKDNGEDRIVLNHLIDTAHQQYTEIQREHADLESLIAAAGQCTCTEEGN